MIPDPLASCQLFHLLEKAPNTLQNLGVRPTCLPPDSALGEDQIYLYSKISPG